MKTGKMKNVITKSLMAVILTLGLSMSAMSQNNQKVGYVNLVEMISIMPSMQNVNSQMKTLAESLNTPDFQAKVKSYETKRASFEAGAATMGDARREVEANEIMQLENQILAQQQNIQQQLGAKEQELMSPIYVEAQNLLDSVAKANGFSIVLDSSQGVMLFAEPAVNILPLVKAKLGVS